MVRARFLQPPLDRRIEAGAIADQDGGDDRRRCRRAPAEAAAHRIAHLGAKRRRHFGGPVARTGTLDERRALHRAHERDAAARERRRIVARSGVVVASRETQ